ncbi:MAG TPA: polyhydroxyalkanoate synthesis regulator DNA-binding domain-containing protein [Xanthobacteraceae bacterium]|jgi:polyhydroxyalkanoate synthesis repressor PhaR|nr:polyhydroxyalkanoate synthesis regulator DNA-binding domain-containing protein [Xanthobacteraceae bacterium]
MAPSEQPVVIKKYPNQRLYHPARRAYVSLDDLATMVEDDEDFVVLEAKTGEDVTPAILKQILRQRVFHG